MNLSADVFLYDRVTKATVLVSRSGGSATRTGNRSSVRPAVSADGRYVAFASNATDIVPITPDPFGEDYKIFLFDRIAGTTELIARTRERDIPEFARSFPVVRISPDGRYLAFSSFAADLVPSQREPKPFETSDVFLWDRETRKIVLVSRSTAGESVAGNEGSVAPQLSADGRFVGFVSYATDLVPGQVEQPNPSGQPTADLFLYDQSSGGTVQVGRVSDNREEPFSMSMGGGVLAFYGLEGGSEGLVLYERGVGTRQVIVDGIDTLPSLSSDGRYMAYVNLSRQVFLYDRITRTSALVTRSSLLNDRQSGGSARNPRISADGRYVAFTSDAEDLVPGQTSAPGRENPDDFDVFLFDRESGVTVLVDRLRSSPNIATGKAGTPLFLNANGRQVVFNSGVDLVDGDFNLQQDVYLFSLDAAPPPGPGPFVPCTLLDTHRAADAPALRSDVRRVIVAAGVCGVPSTAKTISVKVTVLQGSGKGNLRLYPGNALNSAKPSATLRFQKGQTRTASYTLPLATNGAGTLAIVPFVAGKGTVHAVVEVTGYQ